MRAVKRKLTDSSAPQHNQMRAAAKRMTDIAGESANIRSSRTFNNNVNIHAGDKAFFPFNIVSNAVRVRFALDLE